MATLRLVNESFGDRDAAIVFGWIVAGHQLGAATAAFTVPNLTNFSTYTFSVAAVVPGGTTAPSASIGASKSVGSRPVASDRRHDSTIVGRTPGVVPGGSSGPSAPSASRRSQLLCSSRARLSGSVSAPMAGHRDDMAQ